MHRSVVQSLPSSVQAVPAGCLASAGHVVVVPVQLSATSHPPLAAARQIVRNSFDVKRYEPTDTAKVLAFTTLSMVPALIFYAFPAGC